MSLKLITAPVTEPVSLSEIKEYLRFDTSDTSFDNILNTLIIAAREYCENFQNRTYITQTWELTFDYFPDFPLKIPKPPLQSVLNIKYIDYLGVETIFDPSNYIVDTDSEPGRIAFAYNKSWPSVTLQSVNAVKIQFVAGYGDATVVPENVKLAMKVFITHRFENPESKDIPEAFYNLLWQDRMVPI